MSYNSSGRGETDARGALFQAFMDRYYPYAVPGGQRCRPNAGPRRADGGGRVHPEPTPGDECSELYGVPGKPYGDGFKGGVAAGGYVCWGLGRSPKTWVEIGPLLYREKDGQELIGFTRDGAGRLVLSTVFPAEVGVKASLSGEQDLQRELAGVHRDCLFRCAVCVAVGGLDSSPLWAAAGIEQRAVAAAGCGARGGCVGFGIPDLLDSADCAVWGRAAVRPASRPRAARVPGDWVVGRVGDDRRAVRGGEGVEGSASLVAYACWRCGDGCRDGFVCVVRDALASAAFQPAVLGGGAEV